MRTRPLHILALGAALALIGAGCGSDSGDAAGPDGGIDASDAGGDGTVDQPVEDPTVDDPDAEGDPDGGSDPDVPIDSPSEVDANDADVPVEDIADTGDTSDADGNGDAPGDADLGACTPKNPPNTSEAWLVVGVGLSEFTEVDNCDNVSIVEGIQGGYHVWGALRAGGFELESSTFVNLTVRLLDGEETVASANYQDVLPESDGGYEYLAVTVLFSEGDDFDPNDFLGRELLLRARVELEGVVDVTDEVVVVPDEITF